jgi:bleomycin hydrolase
MKKILLSIALVGSSAAYAQDDLINKIKDNGGETSEGFKFETIVDLETTPVKNQGKSGTCWSYATTGFIESEMLRMGKEPVDISEMFTVRNVYYDKAVKYVRLHGYLNFAQGGALPDVLHVIKEYGAVPQEVYEGLNYGTDINNHAELEAILKAQLDEVIKNRNGKLSNNWKDVINATLDSYLGAYPKEFKFKGKTYTPRSFADDYMGIQADDYVQITSFTHYDFNEMAMIQVPDNWLWKEAYNVTLDEMMEQIDHSLEEGYSIAWATDVSEKGFSLKNGVAIVPAVSYSDMTKKEKANMFDGPKDELKVDQNTRQKAYDNYETTDDHGMQITGIVKDQKGAKYYIVKNSWGERDNDFRSGHINASEAFVRYKTIAVLMHKDALAKGLKKKMH